MGDENCVSQAPEALAGEDLRQGGDPLVNAGRGRERAPQLVQGDLARPVGERLVAQRLEVERLVSNGVHGESFPPWS